MRLCVVTDDGDYALEAERAGIDRVMIDLERTGKAARQAGRGLFLSTHRIEAVARLRHTLSRASIVVRTNPLDAGSAAEVDTVVAAGADVLMLPYFFGVDEVRAFLSLVAGRCRVALLVETAAAAASLDAIVQQPGVDEVHVGLNDLSLSLGQPTIVESMCSGPVEAMAATLRRRGVPFGVGGVARLSRVDLPIPPECMLAEQIRLGATRAWLGRSFRGEPERSRQPGELAPAVRQLREAIARWRTASPQMLEDNRARFCRAAARWRASVEGADDAMAPPPPGMRP
jgi:2-keto-3-deoxy-L-rhamnonate aldolase RhmA